MAERKHKCRRELLHERDRSLGMEHPDPTPMFVSGPERPPTLHEEIRRYMMSEFSDMAQEQGVESFEEADDFEVFDDEQDLTSPYTVVDLVHPEIPKDDLNGSPGEPLDVEVKTGKSTTDNVDSESPTDGIDDVQAAAV